MSERGPRFSGPSYGEWRRSQERPSQNIKEELERMYLEASTELAREVIGKLLFMMDAKDRAKNMAQYIVSADPRDITTYLPEKKLGIFLVCDTRSPKTYRVGDRIINQGDQIIQIHIPPRTQPTDKTNLLTDIKDSLQLTSDYIAEHDLHPTYITGCTYEPLVSVMERRYGLKAYRVNIPVEWRERVASVFQRFVDPTVEPSIAFLCTSLEDFQQRFVPQTRKSRA